MLRDFPKVAEQTPIFSDSVDARRFSFQSPAPQFQRDAKVQWIDAKVQ
jgi:hypothetical protein